MPGEDPETESGIGKPDVLDLVTHDPKTDEYALIMVQTSSWDGSPRLLKQLKAKIDNYLHFATDGDLVRKYPQAAGKPVRIQVDCTNQPSAATSEFLARMGEAVQRPGVRFVVNVL